MQFLPDDQKMKNIFKVKLINATPHWGFINCIHRGTDDETDDDHIFKKNGFGIESRFYDGGGGKII